MFSSSEYLKTCIICFHIYLPLVFFASLDVSATSFHSVKYRETGRRNAHVCLHALHHWACELEVTLQGTIYIDSQSSDFLY